MTKVNWDTLEVFEDGYVYWNGYPMEGGDCCHHSESETGLSFELRHTPDIGQHVVAFKGEDFDEYLYTVRCNRPGKYCLGPEYGYRKKSKDEETCPIKQALRHWELSVDKLDLCGPSVIVRRSDPDVPLREGSRRYAYITDAKSISETDRRFGKISDILRDMTYVIELSEKPELIDDPEAGTLIWIERIHVKEDEIENVGEDIAKKIKDIMIANKTTKEVLHGHRN